MDDRRSSRISTASTPLEARRRSGADPFGDSCAESFDGSAFAESESGSPEQLEQSHDDEMGALSRNKSVSSNRPRSEAISPIQPQDFQEAHNNDDVSPISPTNPADSDTGLLHRSPSAASSIARTSSPTQSVVGPSHSYAMYPLGLNGLSRSDSTATASTAHGQATTTSSRTPAHPYALYNQTVPLESQGGNSIPIGFHGVNQGFHRRIGPEGEEQDIVGPDGHTEQLPPYSRYPEEPREKNAAAAAAPMPSIGEASQDPAAAAATSPAEESPPSSDPPTQQQPVEPTQSANNNDDTISNDNESRESPVSEKSWKEKSWKERRKIKFCGLSLKSWIIIAGVLIVLIVALVIGMVIGLRLSNHDSDNDNNPTPTPAAYSAPPQPTYNATASLIAAQPWNTSGPVPYLPSGDFLMQLTSSSLLDSAGCIQDDAQQAAWSCQISDSEIAFTLSNTNTSKPLVSMHVPSFLQGGPLNGLQYGDQAPIVPTTPMQLVCDPTFDDGKAIAWQFQALYTKRVVVPSVQLTDPNDTSRYNPAHTKTEPWTDQPWFCSWNSTFIEMFFYVNTTLTNSTVAYPTVATTPLPSTISSTHSDHGSFVSPASTSYTSPTPMVHAIRRRQDDSSGYIPYPLYAKLIERRLHTSVENPAICEQMQYNYTTKEYFPVIDKDTGQPYVIKVNELDPPTPSLTPAGSGSVPPPGEVAYNQRPSTSDACYCQWQSSSDMLPI